MYACTEGNEVASDCVNKRGKKVRISTFIVHLLPKCYSMLNEEELSEPTFFDSLTVSMTIDSMGLHLQCNIIQKIC